MRETVVKGTASLRTGFCFILCVHVCVLCVYVCVACKTLIVGIFYSCWNIKINSKIDVRPYRPVIWNTRHPIIIHAVIRCHFQIQNAIPNILVCIITSMEFSSHMDQICSSCGPLHLLVLHSPIPHL